MHRYPKLRNSVLFYAWEDARDWARWSHSFHMHLSYPGPVPVFFSHPELPWAHHREGGCRLMTVRLLDTFLSALRLHQITLEGYPVDVGDILVYGYDRRYSISQSISSVQFSSSVVSDYL